MTICMDVTLPAACYQAQKLILVSAGILIDADGRLLIAKRPASKPMAGLWEFPGGKIEANESAEQALVRELKEELGVSIAIGCLTPLTFVSHSYDGGHVLMPLFTCRQWRGVPQPCEGQTLKWVMVDALTDYDFVPADKPLLPQLPQLLGL